MSVNLLKTPKQVFNYLKRYNSDFQEMKKGSEYKSWDDFEHAFFKDEDLVKWLENQIDEINDKKREAFSKAQKESKVCQKNLKKLIKTGTANFKKSTSDPEHQSKAGKAGVESNRKINAERFNAFMEFMMDNLPEEFSPNDLLEIRNNNLENTVMHTSHKSGKPISEGSFCRKFLENAKKMGLIVRIKKGNQFEPTIFHKINEISSIENKEEVVEQVKSQEIEKHIQTNGYFQSSTYSNINLIYQN